MRKRSATLCLRTSSSRVTRGSTDFFVTSVNGIKADYSADGSYWAFYIGDEYAATGVDGEKLGDGSDTVYRLVYTK